MSPTSSQQPIELAVNPDQWVDQYGDYLYRFAVSRLRDTSAAEEAVQETFLAGIRFQNQFAGKGSQRGWLMGILKRKILDSMRQRAKQPHIGSLDDETDQAALLFDEHGGWRRDALPALSTEQQSVEQNLELHELWQVVKACLARIPQRQADVFVLNVMEEMDPIQICEELDITLSNMWVRLHRARLALAKCVSSKWLLAGIAPI